MNADKTLLENPTLLIKSNEMIEAAQKMTELLTIYLMEFCEVMGISEKDLSKRVIIYSNQTDFISVVNVENAENILIGVTTQKDGYEICGEYLSDVERFPKTTSYIQSLYGGNTEGDITTTTGE